MSTKNMPEFILSGKKESAMKKDLFSLDLRLAPLFDLLRNKASGLPLALALEGKPGSGKTYALHWVESQIEKWNSLSKKAREGHPKITPLWFCPLTEKVEPLSLFSEWEKRLEEEKGSRIVVLIDDLDFCGETEALKLLQLIATCSLPLLFVVAFSRETLIQIIQHARKVQGWGRVESLSFLESIFALSFRLGPSPEQAKIFFDYQVRSLGFLEDAADSTHEDSLREAVLQLTQYNPGHVLRILQQATAITFSAKKAGMGDPFLLGVQALQASVLDSWLARLGADLLNPSVTHWLTALAEEAHNPYVEYSWVVNQQMEEENQKNNQGGRVGYGAATSATPTDPPAELSFSIIHEWVWDLLKIPMDFTILNPVGALPSMEEITQEVEVSEQLEISELISKISVDFKRGLATECDQALSALSVEALEGLVQLNLADLSFSETDLILLSTLQSLERLNLHNAQIKQLDWIKPLKKLKNLNLACTPISNLSPLTDLLQLEVLDMSYTQVKDLTPLASLENLTSLILYGSPVEELAPIDGLKNLEQLNLSLTKVDDTQLVHLENLTKLKHLFLRETAVSKDRVLLLKQKLGFDLEVGI